MKKLVLLLGAALALSARAEEGMWTFNAFPKEAVKQQHGFEVTDAWLEKVRLGSARLAQGCSASFVSPEGLVMTNHHCVRGCVEQLSTAERNLSRDGFLARERKDELRCPVLEVNQLVAIADVTARVTAATAGKEGKAYANAQKAELGRIEKECQTSDALRCDVVTLYRGGLYQLYTYRRFQDARLVWVPEQAAAHFGGDPDNFDFPRFALDAAFVRVYVDGKPAETKEHFTWSAAGAADGELVFVSGNPGGTSRQLTIAQLEYQRDVALPERLVGLAELRGLYGEYARRGPEQARHSTAALLGVENSFKALSGRRDALVDKAFFRSRVEEEVKLRGALLGDEALAKATLPAFDAIAAAQALARERRHEVRFIEEPGAFASAYFTHARALVRAADELAKPDAERLREFQDAGLPKLRAALLSTAPIYPEFETLKLGHSLGKLREALGADHPFVKKVLGKESPEALAARLVAGTKLGSRDLRKALLEGGKKAIEASDDPFIALARRVDADSRAVRQTMEEEVESATKRASETIARARFKLQGTKSYPDATFSPRLSYGTVKGFEKGRRPVGPFTTLAGAFERDTGAFPFDLPRSFHAAKDRLDLGTRYNLTTTNDIIGGNSGSPLLNARAEVVGLVFDGNLPSLAGDYGYEPVANRTVAVHSAAILELLRKAYGADRLAEELAPARRAAR